MDFDSCFQEWRQPVTVKGNEELPHLLAYEGGAATPSLCSLSMDDPKIGTKMAPCLQTIIDYLQRQCLKSAISLLAD